MSLYFDSLDNFMSALKEVDVLLFDAQNSESDRLKYLTYNKANLLLLVAKFENFIEQIADEYIEMLNCLKMCAKYIPRDLKINHSLFLIEKSKDIIEHKHKLNEQVKIFAELGELWNGEGEFTSLSFNTKFNYGKHGDKEIVKLFNCIGIKDVFDTIEVLEDDESMLEESLVTVDFKGIINSITAIRNNIIHQDATPELTHVDIKKYKKYLESFSIALTEKVGKALGEIQEVSESRVVANTLKEVAVTSED